MVPARARFLPHERHIATGPPTARDPGTTSLSPCDPRQTSATPAARLANMSGKNNFGNGFGKFDMDKKAAMLASAWQVTQDQQRRRREEQQALDGAVWMSFDRLLGAPGLDSYVELSFPAAVRDGPPRAYPGTTRAVQGVQYRV
ncbi:hypothetical protein FJT64_021139 [Amphibalanus amphitrite]|uniref:Uncharacterized protein n=1 Tax=Amphibalanus amphitrite TaxID=1232801 RepID=A0A6A4WJE5_AMPAM|nr:hypothetical protein FJT64_021139 [Amphibalanus amphitrite]